MTDTMSLCGNEALKPKSTAPVPQQLHFALDLLPTSANVKVHRVPAVSTSTPDQHPKLRAGYESSLFRGLKVLEIHCGWKRVAAAFLSRLYGSRNPWLFRSTYFQDSQDMGGFTIFGAPYWGPYNKGILLFGVYVGGPVFS